MRSVGKPMGRRPLLHLAVDYQAVRSLAMVDLEAW